MLPHWPLAAVRFPFLLSPPTSRGLQAAQFGVTRANARLSKNALEPAAFH